MTAHNDENRIYAEQVNQLYHHTPTGIAATLINGIILTFILRNITLHRTLIVWLSVLGVISVLRYLLYRRFQAAAVMDGSPGHWGQWYHLSMACSGIVWGSAGVFLFPPGSIAHQSFIAFVLGGMVAGAAGAFSALMTAFLAYTLPTLIPIIVHFLALGDDIHLAMGTMVLLFGLLMYFTAKRINRTTWMSFKLKYENTDLIRYLEKAKAQTDRTNAELKTEIQERQKIEMELQRHRKHLEDRVVERTAELTKANTKLQMEIADRRKAEVALSESEEKYRSLVDNANDAILIVQDDIIKFANRASQDISGYSREEVVGASFVDFIHPADRDMVIERYQKRLKGESVPNIYSFKVITKYLNRFSQPKK